MSLKLNDKKMKTKWKKNVTFFSQLIKCKFSLAHGPQRQYTAGFDRRYQRYSLNTDVYLPTHVDCPFFKINNYYKNYNEQGQFDDKLIIALI